MARKIGIDLTTLFPAKSVKIGDVSMDIKPLSLEKIALVTRKLKDLEPHFIENGITWENYYDKSLVLPIVNLILTHTPYILEEILDIDLEDLKQLPIAILGELVSAAIEINLEAKDTLTKNFKGLAANLNLEVKAPVAQRKRDLQG